MSGEAGRRPLWTGEGYAATSGHHRTFDEWFLDQHPPSPHDVVVDAGCGSGEFTARIAQLVPKGRAVGVEPDPSMLEAASRHVADNLEFRQAAMQDLDAVCEPAFADLVIARAVLHWIPLAEHGRCYEAVRRVLRPGGWFHAEAGGAGNVEGLRRLLDDVATGLGLASATVTFPGPGVILELLEEARFEVPPSGVTTVAQRRPFDRHQLEGLVRTQASVAYGLRPSDDLLDAFVAAAMERADELRRHDGSFDQTFVRLHILCRRPA